MSRLFVTGSSGFIGSHVVAEALRRDWSVSGVDLEPPKFTDRNYTHQHCDILNEPRLTQILQSFQPDFVIHLAATHDLSNPVNEARGVAGYVVNTDGTKNLLHAIRHCGCVQRAVFTSTQLVCRIGYIPTGDEDYQPSTYYGQSKALAEQMVKAEDGGGAEWIIVRPTSVWGPGMIRHYQRFLRLVQRGRYFHTSSRSLYKTYGYVENVAYQYLQLLSAPASLVQRRMFYLADYEPFSLRDYANALAQALDAPRIRTIPAPLMYLAAKAGDVLNQIGWSNFPFNSFRLKNILTEYRYDLSPTRHVCGELPCTFEQGIERTARWFSSLPVDEEK